VESVESIELGRLGSPVDIAGRPGDECRGQLRKGVRKILDLAVATDTIPIR
jgi:hypothetical protein